MKAASPVDQTSPSGLDEYGRKEVARSLVQRVVVAAVLFISAGTLAWPGAWAYILLGVFYHLVSARVLTRVNPEVLNARGRKPQNVPRFDKIILPLWMVCQLASQILAGLDVGRWHWSQVPVALSVAGFLAVAAGGGLVLWAMAANAYFEKTVRIQDDRGHQVCSAGPYHYVRHPGYTGIIVASLGGPLLLGSWVALIPGLVSAVLFVWRTAIEDGLLRADLPGYAAFTDKTRYRLMPGVW